MKHNKKGKAKMRNQWNRKATGEKKKKTCPLWSSAYLWQEKNRIGTNEQNPEAKYLKAKPYYEQL